AEAHRRVTTLYFPDDRIPAESPQALHALPAAQVEPLSQAYAQTLHTVFLWTVPVALIGFVVALSLKEVKLRDSARLASTDMGEGFAQPGSGDSEKLLEISVASILHGAGPDTARRIIRESDTRLDMAGAWAVMQVDLFTRMVGHAGLRLIATRHRLPPEVLVPVFDRMIEEGYLTGDGRIFSHTAAGAREARVISEAWGRWLNERLAEDGARPDDGQLRAAVDVIAKRLLAEDLAQELSPEPHPGGSTRVGAPA
ncbi:MFS transporter, partial [Streptomyces cavourensis]|nr:MFS transporter [Streptomyces cavourensis]